MSALDLYSTSATSTCALPQCTYKAPYIAYPKDDVDGRRRWYLGQGSCNHWDCPRCGEIRAKQEYWSIVEGVKTLAENGHDLWFITLTCRGRELPVDDAMAGYMTWTKRVNDAMRIKARRAGQFFTYVAVTEKQRRGHPHSHILTTFAPSDTAEYCALKYAHIGGKKTLIAKDAHGHTRFESEWLSKQAVRAGLGEQVDITRVRDHNAVSRYVAKYLFKDAMRAVFPPNWKRIRYAQNFPRPEKMRNLEAFPVLSNSEWSRLANLGVVTVIDDLTTAKSALAHGVTIYFKISRDERPIDSNITN